MKKVIKSSAVAIADFHDVDSKLKALIDTIDSLQSDDFAVLESTVGKEFYRELLDARRYLADEVAM